MRQPNHTLHRIIKQDGRTIGKRERECDPRLFGNDGISFAAWLQRPGHFLPIHSIRAMRPIGAPIIPDLSLCIEYRDIGPMYLPERSARVRLDTQRLQHEEAIAQDSSKLSPVLNEALRPV